MKVLSVRLLCPRNVSGYGYGLVVPFLVAKFGLWVGSNNEQPKQLATILSPKPPEGASRGAKLARLSE